MRGRRRKKLLLGLVMVGLMFGLGFFLSWLGAVMTFDIIIGKVKRGRLLLLGSRRPVSPRRRMGGVSTRRRHAGGGRRRWGRGGDRMGLINTIRVIFFLPLSRLPT